MEPFQAESNTYHIMIQSAGLVRHSKSRARLPSWVKSDQRWLVATGCAARGDTAAAEIAPAMKVRRRAAQKRDEFASLQCPPITTIHLVG
jgi:hypothetical protein